MELVLKYEVKVGGRGEGLHRMENFFSVLREKTSLNSVSLTKL
jgi:hypothetical protein